MAKFEKGEIALVLSPAGVWKECEIVGLPGEKICRGYKKTVTRYAIAVPCDRDTAAPHGLWQVSGPYLRKKRPPKESDDIRETREKGAPSFSKMMEDLNVEVA